MVPEREIVYRYNGSVAKLFIFVICTNVKNIASMHCGQIKTV
jgi:hypothetical protein